MDLTADLPTSCFSNSDSASYILDIIIIGCRDYYMINRQSHTLVQLPSLFASAIIPKLHSKACDYLY